MSVQCWWEQADYISFISSKNGNSCQMSSSTHSLGEEFYHFDRKVNRTRHFTTLTTSVYHPSLQKQIPLASMDCIYKNRENVSFGLYSTRRLKKLIRQMKNILCKDGYRIRLHQILTVWSVYMMRRFWRK